MVKLDEIETKNAFLGKSIDDLQENYQGTLKKPDLNFQKNHFQIN